METKTKKVINDVIDRHKAGYPIIWVKTEEYARAIELLHTRFQEENNANLEIIKAKYSDGQEIPSGLQPKKIFHWDSLNGLINITNVNESCDRVFPKSTDNKPMPEPPPWAHILSWANHLQTPTVPEGSIILVNGFHNLLAACPATETGRTRQAILQIIQPTIRKIGTDIKCGLREGDSYRTVIFVGPKPEHSILSPDVMTYMEVLDLPRPNEDEIADMIELQLGGRKTKDGENITANKDHVQTCAKELKGATVFQSENAISLTYIKKRALDKNTLRQQYKAIMELHPALSLANYQETWEELIGFDLYKNFIDALFHPSQNRKNHKGVLFTGVPGGGKSHAAKATGQHLGLKTIFCNMGRVFNKFVGDSEANTESLFRSIDACGQAIVFIDEIEKGLGGMGKGHGGDGGVSDRVMQQTLTWMNDHESGAFLIATANDPHILPPELLREGRWDCIFTVPPPNKQQRTALATLYSQKANLQIDALALAERTENWVGAEIKGVVQKAEVFRLTSKNDTDALETAFNYVKPMCTADPSRFFSRLEQSLAQGVSVNAPESPLPNFEIPEDTLTTPQERRRSID